MRKAFIRPKKVKEMRKQEQLNKQSERKLKERTENVKVYPNLKDNVTFVGKTLGDSGDLITRKFKIPYNPTREAAIMYFDGMADSAIVDVLGVVDGDFAVIGDDPLAVATEVVRRMLAAGGELVTVVTGAHAENGLADGVVVPVQGHGPGLAGGDEVGEQLPVRGVVVEAHEVGVHAGVGAVGEMTASTSPKTRSKSRATSVLTFWARR